MHFDNTCRSDTEAHLGKVINHKHFMENAIKLSREDMRKIVGGQSCSANCGNGTTADCSGASCIATDGVGCGASDGHGRSLAVACG